MSLGDFLKNLAAVGLTNSAIRSARRARPQIIATRGRFPSATDGSGANNYTRFESVLYVRTGPKAVSNVQALYTNRYSSISGEAEDVQSDFTLESCIIQNSTVTPFTFGGRKNPLVSLGAGIVASDKLGVLLPANTQLQVRSAGIVSAGQQVPVGQPGAPLAAGCASTSASSQIYSTTGLALPSGGAWLGTHFSHLTLIGIPEQRHVSVLLWGDSILAGSNDTGETTDGHMGWGERGLRGIGGYNVPFCNVSRGSGRSSQYTSPTSWCRFALLEYVTHAVFAMGHNDIANGVSLATLQANCQVAWAAAKRMGVKAYHATLTPKTTSTDNWATKANQTVAANFNQAGIRGQFNAWLYTQVSAGNLDGVIDVASAACDPTDPDKWISNGTANYATTDGIHPSNAVHALMAAPLNTAASSWAA